MSGRLRVLHVAQPTDAGVARCVADLAAAQVRAGLEVLVACPDGGRLAADLAAAGVPRAAWAATRSPGPGVPGETRRLAAVIRDAAPDVVHLHSAKAGLAGRLALRGRLPTVFQPHAWSFDAVTGPVRTATLAWERLGARWTTLLICVSEAERAAGEAAGIAVGQSVVVPNGVDLQAFPAAGTRERAAARRRLGLAAGPLAVCIGRLARQKGQDVLLAAWPGVRARVPAAALVLVGDGPDAAALRRAAGPGVLLAGARTDVTDWLAAADVVVVPSRWEGMALVPLEAMARARSVVVTDVAGAREQVPAGAGEVVPVADAPVLAHAVAARLGGAVDADAEGRTGRAHVAAHHDLAVSTARVTEACQGLR